MNINSVICNRYKSAAAEGKALDRFQTANPSASPKKDLLEISSEAYGMQKDKTISAVSGKDILGITLGDKENVFIIHFSDSAMVNRTVFRGYITVNGEDVELSDEVKKQMIDVDKQAQADRENSYNEYVIQHELAVAKQQSETWKNVYKDLFEAVEIAAKISNGEQVSSQEMKKLIQTDSKLYAMAKAAAAMSERKARQNKKESSGADAEEHLSEEKAEGVSWSDFNWNSYETQVRILMEEKPEVISVSEGEVG
ncbi:MAG: hypothetical protein NC089_11565 [Bacteroides sp.]|nr:hypothetical protein [Bacteroides sp.]MCM1550409.1 hypothetical protein [Clostridium sp.]